ncbi:MAG: P27 family phage terminase small subunit [Proteobacteria bacterium]|nr:P27 family phage terminase small subunit [Pseudomonadota bacterium]
MTAPKTLSDSARVHFVALKVQVAEMGLDSATFTELLALAAERMEEIDECNAIIAEYGRIIETTTEAGSVLLRANPAVTMRNEAMRHLQSLLAEFGLTPTAAARVGAKKKDTRPQGFSDL